MFAIEFYTINSTYHFVRNAEFRRLRHRSFWKTWTVCAVACLDCLLIRSIDISLGSQLTLTFNSASSTSFEILCVTRTRLKIFKIITGIFLCIARVAVVFTIELSYSLLTSSSPSSSNILLEFGKSISSNTSSSSSIRADVSKMDDAMSCLGDAADNIGNDARLDTFVNAFDTLVGKPNVPACRFLDIVMLLLHVLCSIIISSSNYIIFFIYLL